MTAHTPDAATSLGLEHLDTLSITIARQTWSRIGPSLGGWWARRPSAVHRLV